MKVFISWSGSRSRAIAELLDEWIQCVLQAVSPWMSSKDIDRGSIWFSEISDQLKDTKIGIVCLTQSNKNKPWILFEAGALAKGLSSTRVCTFLIDLESSDIDNPLAQFNHTFPNKESVWDLVRTLNSSLGDNCLRENVLEKVFETYWPQFEERFQKALNENPETQKVEPRSEESILVEVLNTVRSMQHRIRDIERSSKKALSREKVPMARSTVHRQITKLINDGVDPNSVCEMFEKNAPSKFINSCIMDALGIDEDDFIDETS